MLNIAFNATPLLSPLTGVGQYTRCLLDELLINDGLSLDLFSGWSWSQQMPMANTSVATSKLKPLVRSYVPQAYSVNRFIKQQIFSYGVNKKSFDLYHEPCFLAFNFDGPIVLTVHDLSWIRYPHTHPKERVQAMNKFFEPSLKSADVVITVSEFVKNELMSEFSIEAQKIKAVPNGVSEQYRPMRALETQQTLARLVLQHGQYFLALGTLEPRKNLVVTMNAFMRLPKAMRQAHPLVLVGMKGWGTTEIEKQLAPLLLTGEVIQLGYLSQADLYQVTAGALALVYASIYEGFGLPPLEAMACGVPVITSNVSSIPEVVGNGGVMLDPADVDGFTEAMRMMIESSEMRLMYAQQALTQSQNFSWKKCAMGTVAAYQQAMLSA
jgi:glycosyltransferase involved in cell wall biosynthesis